MPDLGTFTPIASGIFWLRMPLPFDLNHINLYLVEDGEGYALIDTGIGTKETESLWNMIFESLGKPITKVIVTHMHPDHIGMAGHIVDKFKAPLYMSRAEYFTARALRAGAQGASDWQDDEYLLHCGMSEEYRQISQAKRAEGKGIGQVIKPIPLHYIRLKDADEILIGQHHWRIIVGEGHSPEHLCLHCEEINVLISGDHILPKISPNIGVYSTEPEANPLELYLSTLTKFSDLADDCLVLPSHKLPFIGVHVRIQELIKHHQEHLSNLFAFCSQGRTVEQCLPILFDRKLNEHNMFFAIAESLAHLNYLYKSNQLQRTVNDDGQYVFKR